MATIPTIQNYGDASEFLGMSDGKYVSGKTTDLHYDCENDCINLRHHFTNIVTYYSCGRFKINPGYWAESIKTKQKINKYTPNGFRFFTKGSKSYLEVNCVVMPYEQDMIFNMDLTRYIESGE